MVDENELPLLDPWPDVNLPGETRTVLGVELPVCFSDLDIYASQSD